MQHKKFEAIVVYTRKRDKKQIDSKLAIQINRLSETEGQNDTETDSHCAERGRQQRRREIEKKETTRAR